MPKLTTTTHAILGLLQRRPWSAYELTKYMQRSGIRAVWPRTESRIYVEFKNLTALGLATSQKETHQGRKRTLYKITPAGRKELRAWLKTAEGGLRLESEPLLKLLYTDLSEPSTKLQLDHLKAQLLEEASTLHQAMSEALDSGFYFDGNAYANARLSILMIDLLETRSKWLAEAMDNADKKGSEEAIRVYKRQEKRLARLIAELEE